MEQPAGQGPVGEPLVSGSVSSCAFRRADGASGCCRAKCRAVPGCLLHRAFLLCFCCLHLLFPLISGSWFRLTSLSESFSLLLFSLLQVQMLLFGCLDLTTTGHLTVHGWPSLSRGKAPPSCLPCLLCIFANVLSRLQLRFRCPAPTDPCASENLSSWWLCVLLLLFGWLDRLEVSRGGWSCACVRA